MNHGDRARGQPTGNLARSCHRRGQPQRDGSMVADRGATRKSTMVKSASLTRTAASRLPDAVLIDDCAASDNEIKPLGHVALHCACVLSPARVPVAAYVKAE